MTQPAPDPTAGSATPPGIDPQTDTSSVGQRVDALHQQGYGWLDPSTQVTLAQSNGSTAQVGAQASAIQQALQAGGNAASQVAHFFDDPVLHKQPSVALQLQQYMFNRQGYLPVAEGDLAHVQQSLQSHGYGAGLDVSGAWTPDWQQAMSQAAQDHQQALQTSDQGGGIHAGKGFLGFVSAFLPSHWIPAIVGAVAALPGEVRDLAAGVVGDVTNAVADPQSWGFSETKAHREASAGAHASEFVESLLGNKNAQQTIHQKIEHGFQATMQDVSTILSLAPLGKAATGVNATWASANQAVRDAAGENIGKGLFTDLGAEAAQRGPGTLANTLYRIGPNGKPLGLLNTRLFSNVPVLKQMIYPVKAILNPDGSASTYYYAARTALSYPYRFAGVQAAGSTVQQLALAGAQERGLAALDNAVGGKHSTALADQIYALHTIGGPFGTALDLLSGVAHGPIESAATRAATAAGRTPLIGVNPSQTVGEMAGAANDTMHAALRPLGAGWAFEAGTGVKLDDLIEKTSPEFADWFLNSKLNEMAAAHYAHATVNPALTGQDWTEAFKAASHSAYHDSNVLDGARGSLTGNLAELAAAFYRDSNAIIGQSKQDYRLGIESLAKAWPVAHRIFNEYPDLLITPLSREAVANAKQEAEFAASVGGPAVEAPRLSGRWLQANNPQAEPGSYGIARLDTQKAQDAARYAQRLQAELDKTITSPDPELAALGAKPTVDAAAQLKISQDAVAYLENELGVAYHELNRFSAQDLVGMITDKARTLSSRVHLPLDAPTELKQLVGQLREAGYEPVFGTDIGHQFASPIIDPVAFDGIASLRRKIASAMGLNNLPVSTTAAGTLRVQAVIREWQQAINDGRIRIAPGMNAARLFTHMNNVLENKAGLGKIEGGLFRLAGLGFKHQIEYSAQQIAGPEGTAEDYAKALVTAREQIEAQIAQGTQPLEVPGKQIRNALMSVPDSLFNELHGLPEQPLMDKKSAILAHQLMLEALGKEPSWAFGAGKIEDFARAGFGFAGTAPAQLPIVRRMVLLPNELARFRNKYRFTADPMFSLRRIAKTALKAGLEDVPVTMRPFSTMVKQGTLDEDLNTLNRVLPMKGATGFDNNDRALHEQDVFGLYNPRHYMALAAGQWQRDGLTDPQILDRLQHTFTYGDRSALERTIGTFFYPFSFEKTLYRNLGGYLMDRPGDRLLLGAALQAWDALSKHEHIGDFLTQHAPILKEFQKLNAFDHGIGPGQWGGINAGYAPALWNVFGPQKLGVKAMQEPGLNAVLQVFPVLRDLNSMLYGENVYNGTHKGYGTVVQQAQTTYWGMRNAIDDVTRWASGDKRSPWNPQHPSTTYAAQQQKAWSMRNAMIGKLAPVLDYNYHNPHNERTWSDSPDLPAAMRGQPINRSTIDELVHRFYPAFDPAAAQSLAVAKQTEVKRVIGDMENRNPARASYYQAFFDAAKKVQPAMQRAEENPALYGKVAQVTSVFRQYAVNLAEQDSTFLNFYQTYYASQFGPIEELQF